MRRCIESAFSGQGQHRFGLLVSDLTLIAFFRLKMGMRSVIGLSAIGGFVLQFLR